MRSGILFERSLCWLLAASLLFVSVPLSQAQQSAQQQALASVAPDPATDPLPANGRSGNVMSAQAEAPVEPLSQNADERDETRTEAPNDNRAPTRLERARSALALSNAPTLSNNEVCSNLIDVARVNALPVGFFTNLIWRESKFDHEAISRAGAMGIAQFMPDVAEKLGLDAFDARNALPASGRLLRRLFARFNNLGLVAAAYNAGPKRVFDWLRQRSTLPKETRDYVNIVTGRPVDQWLGRKSKAIVFDVPRQVPCHRSAAFSAVEGAEHAAQLRKAAEELKLIEKVREAARVLNLQKKGKYAVVRATRTKSPTLAQTPSKNASLSHAVSLHGGDKRVMVKRNLRST
jgi:soluble lytic murein transglycosylase-like protein